MTISIVKYIYTIHNCPEPVLVDLLRSQEPIPTLACRYGNPICRTGPPGYIGWRIDSSESIHWLHKRLQIQALFSALDDQPIKANQILWSISKATNQSVITRTVRVPKDGGEKGGGKAGSG
jgi:hypothetical protein